MVIVTATNGTGVLANDTAIGTELLKDMMEGPDLGITVTANDEFYILAFDAGNAYLYYAHDLGNTALVAAEIFPIAKIDGVTADSFVAEDFILG